jgi:hypothetical protein
VCVFFLSQKAGGETDHTTHGQQQQREKMLSKAPLLLSAVLVVLGAAAEAEVTKTHKTFMP